MSKFLSYLVASILLVAFAFSNSDHVSLSFVFGTPIQIRLIFLLLVTFLAGAAVPVFCVLLGNARRRGRGRREVSPPASEVMHEP